MKRDIGRAWTESYSVFPSDEFELVDQEQQRYMLFAKLWGLPSAGWFEYMGGYPTPEKAIAAVAHLHCSSWTVVDVMTRVLVAAGRRRRKKDT